MIRPAMVTAFLLLAACRTVAPGGRAGAVQPGEVGEKRPSDSDRPTDDSEGLEAYLIDPSRVQATASSAGRQVQGLSGAVLGPGGRPGAASILLASASSSSVASPARSLTVKVLSTTVSAADGSFAFAPTVIPSGDAVILAIGSQGAGPTLALPFAAQAGRAPVVGAVNGFGPFAPVLGAQVGPSAVKRLFISELGRHAESPGPACDAGQEPVDSVADCGGGSCFGVQWVCRETYAYVAGEKAPVLLDVKLSPIGARSLTMPPCDQGYEPVGAFADCSGGACNGVQSVCALYRAYDQVAAGTSVVDAVFMTHAGSHDASGACPQGYESRGVVADCAFADCRGLQALCAHLRAR